MRTVHSGYRLGILASYWYYKRKDLSKVRQAFAPIEPEFMVDSGAFSAWSMNGDVSIENYIAWVQRWRSEISSYVNLDAIGDPERTAENQRAMEAAGLQPIPVFHYGSDWRYLDRYLDAGHRYIMLGGMVSNRQRGKGPIMRWLIRCFRTGEGRAVFHGLGASGASVLESLPFYSADSSSWLSGVVRGRISLFDPWRAKWITAPANGRGITYEQGRVLHLYSLSTARLRTLEADRKKRHATGDRVGTSHFILAIEAAQAASWLLYERYLRQRHGPILLEGRDPGMRYYIVRASAAPLPFLPQTLRTLVGDLPSTRLRDIGKEWSDEL